MMRKFFLLVCLCVFFIPEGKTQSRYGWVVDGFVRDSTGIGIDSVEIKVFAAGTFAAGDMGPNYKPRMQTGKGPEKLGWRGFTDSTGYFKAEIPRVDGDGAVFRFELIKIGYVSDKQNVRYNPRARTAFVQLVMRKLKNKKRGVRLVPKND